MNVLELKRKLEKLPDDAHVVVRMPSENLYRSFHVDNNHHYSADDSGSLHLHREETVEVEEIHEGTSISCVVIHVESNE